MTSMKQLIAPILILNSYTPNVSAIEQNSFDQLWSHATLYDNQSNQPLQKLVLSGRLQAESYYFDANDQGDIDDSLYRRSRLGFKARLLDNWVVHIEGDFDLNSNADDRYNRLTDAYLSWSPNQTTTIKLLKQSIGFTLDGQTSSKSLLTLQRNNLTNNLWFTAEYFTGASISGHSNNVNYTLGVYSTDDDDQLSQFDASYFSLIALDHDFAHQLALDQAIVSFQYVYNDEDADANTRDFSQVLSLNSQFQLGDMGLWTDLALGEGYNEQSNLWGITLMPFYNINKQLQAVLRYSYLHSTGNNGVRLGRYENELEGGRGDEYNEWYTGLNVFIYGHKLKWQTGLQYTTLDDAADDGGQYDGWGLTTGLRLSW